MEKSSITEERILKPLGGIPMLLFSLFFGVIHLFTGLADYLLHRRAGSK